MKTILIILFAAGLCQAASFPASFTQPAAPVSETIIEQNGLLYNLNRSAFVGFAPILISDAPGLSVKRKVVNVRFTREEDFHLTIRLQIDYFNANGSHFLTSALNSEPDTRKRAQLQDQFRPILIERSTRESWVDPATFSTRKPDGITLITPQNTAGAIEERAWFQGLGAAQVQAITGINPADMSYEQVYYLVTLAMIMQMDNLGQL